MTDEPDTPEPGTDNVTAQADDTAETWDYYDPDDDQDTVEAAADEATDDGMEPAEEAASTEEQPAEAIASQDALVEMADGSKVKVADLIKGHLRQDDYTRKAQALANERTAFKAEVERMQGITDALVDHLTKLIPPMPDHSLALKDPQAYTRERAIHEAAAAQLQGLIELGQKPKEIKEALSKEEQAKKLAEENALLTAKFPETANPEGRKKFLGQAITAAQEFGFTQADLNAVASDHRIIAALHYAAKGLQASKAMDVAKAKVEKAPPVAAPKPPVKRDRNAEAVRKFERSPTLRNAVAMWDGS